MLWRRPSRSKIPPQRFHALYEVLKCFAAFPGCHRSARDLPRHPPLMSISPRCPPAAASVPVPAPAFQGPWTSASGPVTSASAGGSVGASEPVAASASVVRELTPSKRGLSPFWLVLGGCFRFTFARWLLGEVLGLVCSLAGLLTSSRRAIPRSWRRIRRRRSSGGRLRASSSIGTMSSSGSRFRPASSSWRVCYGSFRTTR